MTGDAHLRRLIRLCGHSFETNQISGRTRTRWTARGCTRWRRSVQGELHRIAGRRIYRKLGGNPRVHGTRTDV